MPVSAKYGTFTHPTTSITGCGFAPIAIFVWTNRATATGAADGLDVFSMGCGTERGGSVQQWYQWANDEDGQGTSWCGSGIDSTALLKGAVQTAATTSSADFELDLSSLDADGFTVAWTDPPATNIIVNYLALGGSSITDALAFTHTGVNAATQDVDVSAQTGGTGWTGQPDALLYNSGQGGFGTGDGNGFFGLSLGAGSKAALSDSRVSSIQANDNSATEQLNFAQVNDLIFTMTGSGGEDARGDLSATAAWGANGYEISWSNTPGTSFRYGVLALQGVSVKVGTIATATSVTTTSLACGFAPAAALIFGGNQPTSASIQTAEAASTQFGAWGIGATDGTNEGCAGLTHDDANTTMNVGGWHSTSKAWQVYDPNTSGAPSLTAEADATFSGNDLVLSWTDADATARELCAIVFGPGATGPTEHERSASIAATATVTAANREFFTTFERAAAIAATAAVAATGTFWTTFERSAALAATGAVTVTGVFWTTLERSAAIAATAAISSSGEFETPSGEHERAASIAATGTVTVAHQRDHYRSAALAATAAISGAGAVQGVTTRSATLTATAAVTAAYQRAHHRQTSITTVGAVQAGYQRALHRQAAVAATGQITATGTVNTTLQRAAAVTATFTITAGGGLGAHRWHLDDPVTRWPAGTDNRWPATTDTRWD